MSTRTHAARDGSWPAALPAISRPTTSVVYWPAAVLAVLALAPGLLNLTALDLVRPTIAESLGVSPAEVSWATLLGNAALPLGFLVAIDLMRRVAPRRLTLTALGLLVVSTVCAAVAPNLPMFVFAHVTQGFASGLASGAVAVWLLTRSTPDRLPSTIVVLGIGLFGAATLGPLIGGVVEQASAWRGLLILEAILALIAVLPALVVPWDRPAEQQAPIGVGTLVLAAFGLISLFGGIAELSWHHWTQPQVQVPAVLGVTVVLALIVGDWVRSGAPSALRHAGVGLLACLGAFAFAGLLASLLELLRDVRDLGAQDAGLLLWPAPVAAVLALVLMGRVFARPKWVMPLATLGVLLLAVVAWQLTLATEYTDDGSVMQMAALLGAGGGLSIAPAMLLGALSVPTPLVGRALGSMMFVPNVLLAASGPVVTYASSVRQTVHYGNLLWEQGWTGAVDTTAGAHAAATSGSVHALVTRSLMFGINDAAAAVVLVCVFGAATSALVLRSATRPSARRAT